MRLGRSALGLILSSGRSIRLHRLRAGSIAVLLIDSGPVTPVFEPGRIPNKSVEINPRANNCQGQKWKGLTDCSHTSLQVDDYGSAEGNRTIAHPPALSFASTKEECGQVIVIPLSGNLHHRQPVQVGATMSATVRLVRCSFLTRRVSFNKFAQPTGRMRT